MRGADVKYERAGAPRENAKSLSQSELKEKARLVKDIVEEGNLDLIDEHFADDYVWRSNAVPEPQDRDGVKEVVSMFRAAFSDLEITSEEFIAEGDTVVRRDRITATHDGAFMGIEPTGNDVEFQNINIERLDNDGKVVDERAQFDMLGLMQQLGVVEPPGA